jgi:hypothetical protein
LLDNTHKLQTWLYVPRNEKVEKNLDLYQPKYNHYTSNIKLLDLWTTFVKSYCCHVDSKMIQSYIWDDSLDSCPVSQTGEAGTNQIGPVKRDEPPLGTFHQRWQTSKTRK